MPTEANLTPMPHALSRQHRVLLWLMPLALANGLLSAISWPQSYTLTHMVMDYHFGFGKRGLIGAILERIDHPPYHYITLACMAFGVFALWLVPLIAGAWRIIRTDFGVAAAFALFLCSAGFASLVCDVGRGEHFGLLLAIPCLLAPVRPSWLPLRIVLTVAAVLMQEANFLIVAPVIAFDIWVSMARGNRPHALLYALGTLLPAAVFTWYLGNAKTACTLAATAHFQHMAADFTVLYVPVATLCMDAKINFHLVAKDLWSAPDKVAFIPLALAVALPSTLLNIYLAARILSWHRIGVAFAAAASFAPLGLLILGADVVRFVTLTQLCSLLVLFVCARRAGVPHEGTMGGLTAPASLVAGLMAFQLGTAVTLNDASEMLKFPYMPLVARTIAVLQGRAPFIVIQ